MTETFERVECATCGKTDCEFRGYQLSREQMRIVHINVYCPSCGQIDEVSVFEQAFLKAVLELNRRGL